MRLRSVPLGFFSSIVAVAVVGRPAPAEACGCLSPPAVTEGDYAVNQQAEQIVFEVGESTVTAHVLIRYEGDPAQFAWILPAPNVPELAISEPMAFPLLDAATAPPVGEATVNACPGAAYYCRYHADPCDPWSTGGDGGGFVGPPDAGSAGGDPPPGVDVLDMQIVGDYETVTFAAQDAALAVQWLQDNGFVVNDTMTPYMQPYIDAGMVFVAAKLVAGAGLDAIKPLKMTYQGTTPMIPLRLTAVATEPHLTVTAYIYANGSYYAPVGRPLVPIPADRLSLDASGRSNYPMAIARAIDEAGGDGFVVEYAGPPPSGNPGPDDDPSGCCSDGSDGCDLGGDGACQCPASDFDAADCAQVPGLVEGANLLEALAASYTHVTRLTTRLSAEEMTFDPEFEPSGRITPPTGATARRYVFDGCGGDVIDTAEAALVDAVEDCSAVYCGHGTCVATDAGVGCACDGGYVARVFTDLDGQRSVTCVPETPPVILDKDIVLPDPCAGVSCGAGGTCIDLGGFAACDCGGAQAAVVSDDPESLVPVCRAMTVSSGGPGAENLSARRKEIPVCFATPPSCGAAGWLEPVPAEDLPDNGVLCSGSMPDPQDLVPPPEPDPQTCDGPATSGSGSATATGGATAGTDGGGAGQKGAASACACRGGPTRGAPLAAAFVVLGVAALRRRAPRP